jgi:hypothetical protein
MKLSTAMMMGSATVKMEAGNWNSCAIGAALNAMGVPQGNDESGIDRVIDAAFDPLWPWLRSKDPRQSQLAHITLLFDKSVCTGKMTFEQLVDYVRSIEPECGECNRFQCSCRPQEIVEQTAALAFTKRRM